MDTKRGATMARTGRPKVEPGARKDKIIKFRVSDSEHEAIKKIAEFRELSVSDLVKIGLSREGVNITLEDIGQRVVESMVNDGKRDRVNLDKERLRTSQT
jgi:hypothetical protein